jgi:hypothetical protein
MMVRILDLLALFEILDPALPEARISPALPAIQANM